MNDNNVCIATTTPGLLIICYLLWVDSMSIVRKKRWVFLGIGLTNSKVLVILRTTFFFHFFLMILIVFTELARGLFSLVIAMFVCLSVFNFFEAFHWPSDPMIRSRPFIGLCLIDQNSE